ncbi:hypothetical protein [Flavobacterium beibuense]|uniref:hypothetical protein n=1 Tax=Flavobacterium beibuense TaxID=657326 RepID=UPI003A95DD38
MTFNCKEQLAGFAQIEFYLIAETSNWPLVVTDTNSGQIILTPEENDVDGSIEENSIGIRDKPKFSAEGNIWPVDISFVYMSRSEAMEQLLEQYSGLPGIAIACLNDGSKKLYGTDQEPIYLSWDNSYGEKPEDKHGVSIRIKGDIRQRPVFYTPAQTP